jgi:hypothetical protein
LLGRFPATSQEEIIMVRSSIAPLSLIIALVVSAFSISYTASAQQAAEGKAKAPRLPNFYARVSTVDQQEKLREVVKQFASRIQQKRSELQALIAERDAALDKLLTPEQRQQVAKLRDEAAARRKAATEAAKESPGKAETQKTKGKDAA